MSQLGSIGSLSVDLIARLDRLEAGFKEGEKRAANAGKRIEKAVTTGGLSGITQVALKAFAAFSLVEGGIKAATVVSEAFKGEWEKAGVLIKQLPLGIGPLAQGIEGLVLSTTSWGKSITKAREELVKTEQMVKRLARSNELIASRRLSAQKSLNAAREEGILIGVGGFDADIINLNRSSQARIDELQKQLASAQSKKEQTDLRSALSAETINTSRRRAQLALRISAAGEERLTSPTFGRRQGRFEASSSIGRPAPADPAKLIQKTNALLQQLIGITKTVGSFN